MINWTQLLSKTTNVKAVTKFAEGKTSGTEFYSSFAGTKSGGTARYLLREHGVTYARRLARKALRRRGVSVNNQST